MNTPNGFTEYRYVKSKIHNAPKLAFKFEVEYSPDENEPSRVIFSYAICNEKDNFCRATARTLLDQRMDVGQYLVGEYRGKELSLVETAMELVNNTIDSVDELGKEITNVDKNLVRKINNLKKLRDSYVDITRINCLNWETRHDNTIYKRRNTPTKEQFRIHTSKR